MTLVRTGQSPTGLTGGARVSAAFSARWATVSTLAQQVVRVCFSLLLARLIGPSGYGIVAFANIYLALLSFLVEQGLASAIIQRRSLDRRDVGSVFWLNLATTGVLVIGTLIFASPISAFFKSPALAAVLMVLAIDVALKGL